MNRKRKWLTGPLCLMAPTRWWCRRTFCLRAKPPPLTQAQSASLHPAAARSAKPRPLQRVDSLMLRPLVPPDLHHRPLADPLLLRTRRRRTALRARRRAPKRADRLWMPSFLPSSSSSSGTTPVGPEPPAERTLRWASWTCSHWVTLSPLRWSSRTGKWRVSAAPAWFLPPGATWESLSERGWTSRPCDTPHQRFHLTSYHEHK